MKEYFISIWEVFKRYRHLMANLVRRDISVKYRRSALGLVWSVLNPFLMMLIMTAVFSYMFRVDIEYFPVYLLSGQLVFNFFADSTTAAMDSILGNAALIKKIYVPKYIFPLEKIIFTLINTGFSLIALVIVYVFMGVPATPWLLLFPLPFLLSFFFNLGVGMVLSSLVIFFRDIKHIYGVVTLALTYMTPLFYPESLLSGTMQMLIKINPMYWYVALFRQLILVGAAPTGTMLLITCGWAAFALLLGLFVMKKTQDKFILYI